MKCMHKMKVIAKISCNFLRNVVTRYREIAQKYLVTYNTPLLLWIKNLTV